MASDLTKPLLRLKTQPPVARPIGRPRPIPQPEAFGVATQRDKFRPVFQRLNEVLQRGDDALAMRADPASLAPERLLVFEVRGSIGSFANAIRNVNGLELIDEEELTSDPDDKAPVMYLLVPDMGALRQIESLWRRWNSGQLVHGETPWRNVFELLRDLRPWGPSDRISDLEQNILADEIFGKEDADPIRLEIELVFRANEVAAARQERILIEALAASGAVVISRERIADIGYHSLLVDVPVRGVRSVIARNPESIAGMDPVMHIRPQSLAEGLEVVEAAVDGGGQAPADAPLGRPVLALLDGVPVAAHRALVRHLSVDDQFGLEPMADVQRRVHGTAMASLIVHGDRNRVEAALPRQLHVVPVLGDGDEFPDDRLIVGLIYAAILRMKDGVGATAPGVLIVNMSLGNARRPFHGQLSAWSRLLDRLAYRFGLLFIVSAGNCRGSFGIPAYASNMAFEDAVVGDRRRETLRALGMVVGQRRLLSPGETVNGITVGAVNEDLVAPPDRALARAIVDPYGDFRMANPSSALGPGYANSVKPDILMPGAREHLRLVATHAHIDVVPGGPGRSAGLKVASPPRNGVENLDGFTNGTSGATALASRTAHRIFDALEENYGADFTNLPGAQQAVILKALLVHPARWPTDAAELIREIIGPADGRQHVRQRDNIRRYLGFGYVDADDAVACASDRATFWATGDLFADQIAMVQVPIPMAFGGKPRVHSIHATLAWFTPPMSGRKSYRSVRLRLLEPDGLAGLGMKAHSDQPDANQTNRGTVFSRCWIGERVAAVGADSVVTLSVQRDPHQGVTIDEAVPFGLAVSIAMPGVLEIYEQVQQRLNIRPRAPV